MRRVAERIARDTKENLLTERKPVHDTTPLMLARNFRNSLLHNSIATTDINPIPTTSDPIAKSFELKLKNAQCPTPLKEVGTNLSNKRSESKERVEQIGRMMYERSIEKINSKNKWIKMQQELQKQVEDEECTFEPTFISSRRNRTYLTITSDDFETIESKNNLAD